MPKKRERSEVEYYRSIIRELEKENRKLKKELKYHTKREELYENNREEIHEVLENKKEIKVKKLKRCDDCSKGFLEEIEIMNKVFGTCNICGFRKKLK